MAGFNKYNPPGWGSGVSSALDGLDRLQQERGMTNLEAGFNADGSDQSSGAVGLASLNGQSPADSGAGDVASPGMPGAPSMPRGPTMDPGLANAQRRASLMRSTGDPDGANKEMAAQTALGLSAAQMAHTQALTTGIGIKNKVDQTSLDRQTKADQIDQGVAADLQSNSIDPSSGDGAVIAGKKRVAAFGAAGLFDHARNAAETMTKTQTNLLTSQNDERADAANKIVQAAMSTGVTPQMVAQFHSFIPDGTSVQNVVINPDKGYTITTKDDATGETHKETVAGSKVSDLYRVLGSADGAGMIAKQLKEAAEIKLNEAQRVHALASANSANASAGHSAAETKFTNARAAQFGVESTRSNDVFNNRVELGQVPDGADLTPDQSRKQAMIDAADDSAVSRRGRNDPNATSDVRLLTQQRVGLEKSMTLLSNALQSARPADRPALQAQLDTATRSHDKLLADMETTRVGAGASAAAAPPSAAQQSADAPPPGALNEGKITRFGNGQAWTMQGGKAVRVN